MKHWSQYTPLRNIPTAFLGIIDGLCGILTLGYWMPNLTFNWIAFVSLSGLNYCKKHGTDIKGNAPKK